MIGFSCAADQMRFCARILDFPALRVPDRMRGNYGRKFSNYYLVVYLRPAVSHRELRAVSIAPRRSRGRKRFREVILLLIARALRGSRRDS